MEEPKYTQKEVLDLLCELNISIHDYYVKKILKYWNIHIPKFEEWHILMWFDKHKKNYEKKP